MDKLPRVRMRPIVHQPSLVDQVVEAIVTEIVNGDLPPHARLIQDDLAQAYGVSRQPVQQALLLLRNQGLVKEAPGRGLIVAPLDLRFIGNLYEIREALDGLAARRAAEKGAGRARSEGRPYIARGREAVKDGKLGEQIAADMAFHAFVNDLSENPLIGETTTQHWPVVRRVMAEVLRDADQMPRTIWDEHAGILDAISAGDAVAAETLARRHIANASTIFIERLRTQQDAADAKTERRSRLIQRMG